MQRALELNSDWFDGHYNLGNLLSDMGPERESAALAAYERALEIAPDEVSVAGGRITHTKWVFAPC